MRMRIWYLDCHEAGLCWFLMILIGNPLHPFQLFYLHLWPNYWISLVQLCISVSDVQTACYWDTEISYSFQVFYTGCLTWCSFMRVLISTLCSSFRVWTLHSQDQAVGIQPKFTESLRHSKITKGAKSSRSCLSILGTTIRESNNTRTQGKQQWRHRCR
jgi:hypothetical protein